MKRLVCLALAACTPTPAPTTPTIDIGSAPPRTIVRFDDEPETDSDAPVVASVDDGRIEIPIDGIALVPGRSRVTSFSTPDERIVDVDFHPGGGLRILPLRVGTIAVRYTDASRGLVSLEVVVVERPTRCARTTRVAFGQSRVENVGDLLAGVSRAAVLSDGAAIVNLLPEGSGMISIQGQHPGRSTFWMFPRVHRASCLAIEVVD